MAGQGRLDAPGALHHVMIREIEGVEAFRDNWEGQTFISRAGQPVQTTRIPVLA